MGKVTVFYWKSNEASSKPDFGHLSLRTYDDDGIEGMPVKRKMSREPGIYVSLWPRDRTSEHCKCKTDFSHFHYFRGQQESDEQAYGASFSTSYEQLEIEGLDTQKINRKFTETTKDDKNYLWRALNGCCTNKYERNCSGIVLDLLIEGGIEKFIFGINNLKGWKFSLLRDPCFATFYLPVAPALAIATSYNISLFALLVYAIGTPIFIIYRAIRRHEIYHEFYSIADIVIPLISFGLYGASLYGISWLMSPVLSAMHRSDEEINSNDEIEIIENQAYFSPLMSSFAVSMYFLVEKMINSIYDNCVHGVRGISRPAGIFKLVKAAKQGIQFNQDELNEIKTIQAFSYVFPSLMSVLGILLFEHRLEFEYGAKIGLYSGILAGGIAHYLFLKTPFLRYGLAKFVDILTRGVLFIPRGVSALCLRCCCNVKKLDPQKSEMQPSTKENILKVAEKDPKFLSFGGVLTSLGCAVGMTEIAPSVFSDYRDSHTASYIFILMLWSIMMTFLIRMALFLVDYPHYDFSPRNMWHRISESCSGFFSSRKSAEQQSLLRNSLTEPMLARSI